MSAPIVKLNSMSRVAVAAALSAAPVSLALADDPAWPTDFDARVAARIAAVTPSGSQAGSAAHAQAVSVVPSATEISNGGNVSSWPKGVVLSFR